MGGKKNVGGKKKKTTGGSRKGPQQDRDRRKPALTEMPAGYAGFLGGLKRRIARERVRAVLAANSAMVMLYWEIGRAILVSQEKEGWGTKVVDRLSLDLRRAFPEMTGLGVRNLLFMRQFGAAWPDRAIVKGVLSQLPWYHNLALLQKLDKPDSRLWYAEKALELGLSRDLLVTQIESRLHEREGHAQHNFADTLPPADSDMAAQAFKDPYLLDFLGSADPRREAELEQRLVDHIQRFLLELGQGFAFVGRQVPITVGEREFRMDLVFYHLRLRCYVILELKAGRFEPEYVGKLNMYLHAVDDILSHPDDKPSIGLLLVRQKDQLLVEYSLAGTRKPMGVAQWERELTQSLPEELRASLPTVAEIEAELGACAARGATGTNDDPDHDEPGSSSARSAGLRS